MSIIRSARRANFTAIANQVFTSGLSFRAMGVLAYLLTKPDHWEVSVAQLVKLSSTTARPDGRDSVYKVLEELIAARFIRRIMRRNGGKLDGYDYEVHDTPLLEEPSSRTTAPEPYPTEKREAASSEPSLPAVPFTAKPDTAPFTDLPDTVQPEKELQFPALPYPAPPFTAEPTQVTTDLEVRTEKIANSRCASAHRPKASVSPAEEASIQTACRAIWADFERAYRGRYGVPPIRNARVNSQVRQLHRRLGAEAPAVAEFFVGINEAFLARKSHDIGVLVASAEAYRTQWATGRAITSTEARQLDQTQSNATLAERVVANLDRMGAFDEP